MVMIPPYVPEAFLTMYLPAIYAGLIVGFIGTMAIAMKREEIHILILTDLVGLAMIFVVSAVGTDLAEALILPGLVVELAETLAISEILITREMRKIEQDPRRNLSKSSSLFPQPFSFLRPVQCGWHPRCDRRDEDMAQFSKPYPKPRNKWAS